MDGHVNPPVNWAAHRIVSTGLGKAVRSPREHQDLTANDTCGQYQPQHRGQSLAHRLARPPMGAHYAHHQQDHAARSHYFHWPPKQSDDKTHNDQTFTRTDNKEIKSHGDTQVLRILCGGRLTEELRRGCYSQ
jgi:hypothetical protein